MVMGRKTLPSWASLRADYTTSVVAIYFGCSDPATCDDTELSTPDAEIDHNPGEFSAFDGVHMMGEYYRRNTDTQVYDDLFVGGNGFAEFGGTDQQAYVIAGRSTADWEASGSFVINANGDAAAGIANVGNGVLTIKSPATTAIPGRSAVVINTNTDAAGNAYSQLVISAHSNPATGRLNLFSWLRADQATLGLYNKPKKRFTHGALVRNVCDAHASRRFWSAIVGGIDADGNQIDLDGVDGADIAISVNSRIAVLNNTLQRSIV